jgi:hypothetical protein
MMEWMSRILVGEMAGADEDFGSEVGQNQLIFFDISTANPTQHDRHGPDDPFRTINFAHRVVAVALPCCGKERQK